MIFEQKYCVNGIDYYNNFQECTIDMFLEQSEKENSNNIVEKIINLFRSWTDKIREIVLKFVQEITVKLAKLKKKIHEVKNGKISKESKTFKTDKNIKIYPLKDVAKNLDDTTFAFEHFEFGKDEFRYDPYNKVLTIGGNNKDKQDWEAHANTIKSLKEYFLKKGGGDNQIQLTEKYISWDELVKFVDEFDDKIYIIKKHYQDARNISKSMINKAKTDFKSIAPNQYQDILFHVQSIIRENTNFLFVKITLYAQYFQQLIQISNCFIGENDESIGKEFIDAVDSDNLRRVRIMLCDSILVNNGKASKQLDNQINYAQKRMKNLWDDHDEELDPKLTNDKSKWTQDYMNELFVVLKGSNFSKKRFYFVRDRVAPYVLSKNK